MNRLAGETSPYLLQHAGNPVDWQPWGDEAFAHARERDVPVLLSIGYSACHWCHVMAHESFEDEAIGRLVNDNFVAVKVDREERPDVDALYMQAVLALTGQGGWPMTVFLTPQGEPFYGGTYYPPEPRGGLPSFRDVLAGVTSAYRERRDQVVEQAARLTGSLRARTAEHAGSELPPSSTLIDALAVLRAQFDERRGGFGGAPKFPPHATLRFLLRMHRRTGSAEALRMATTTLDRMADGGIHDQLGGGFHRYAVDAVWLVPHFEKMLYDNALLARAYVAAYQVTREARYREVAASTLDYLLRELRLEHGGYASAQDADTDGREGLTFTWTPAQVREVLGDEAALVEELYGITAEGNFEGATVLSRVRPLDEAAERSGVAAERLPALVHRLHGARDRRPQPARDDKALASWNGMALAALAEAGRTLDRRDYLEAARDCAGFLLGPLSRADGGLWRTHRDGRSQVAGFLDDYAQVAAGLYELHLSTREPRWLAECRRLARLAVARFSDREHGGFHDTADDAEQLVARPKELDDNPTPSGNSTLAGVLLLLARIDGDAGLERLAAGVPAFTGPLLARAPTAFGHALGVLDDLCSSPRELAIVGDADDPATEALADAALARYDPGLAIAFAPAADNAVALLAGREPIDGRPTAYLCERFSCLAPIGEPAALRAALEQHP